MRRFSIGSRRLMSRYKDYDRGSKRRDFENEPERPAVGRPSTHDRTSPQPRRPTASQVTGQVAESIGTVRLYKVDKGFGFVEQDGGGKDVFVHATALARAGLTALFEGQRVRMQIGQGQKGLEAQTIEILD